MSSNSAGGGIKCTVMSFARLVCGARRISRWFPPHFTGGKRLIAGIHHSDARSIKKRRPHLMGLVSLLPQNKFGNIINVVSLSSSNVHIYYNS